MTASYGAITYLPPPPYDLDAEIRYRNQLFHVGVRWRLCNAIEATVSIYDNGDWDLIQQDFMPSGMSLPDAFVGCSLSFIMGYCADEHLI